MARTKPILNKYEKDPWANGAPAEVTLPHLHIKLYPWQRNMVDSTNKINLTTAANQAGKSSGLIIKNIHWATEVDLWSKLFKKRPKQFWYLYPDWNTITTEFEEKWKTEYLPRGMKSQKGKYAWEVLTNKAGEVRGIHFKYSGVNIWFRTYSQRKTAIMASTVSMITFDEEMPIVFLPELQARLNFTNGYLNGGFTATICQDFWYRAMECKGTPRETFKSAFKQTVSLYDCMFYEDGTPSPDWTEERIQAIIESCTSENEVQRRVYGRFVAEESLKYSTFSPDKHVIKAFDIPKDYAIYAAVDCGSGGPKNHPTAIVFLAVNPEHTKGYVYKGWRGDGIETETSDIMAKFKEMRGADKCTMQVYDFAAKDFGIIATRIGEPFTKADKARDLGEGAVNTLFRNLSLFIFDLPDLGNLVTELSTLRHSQSKLHAKDDFIDAMRYAVMSVPWDWTGVVIDEKAGNKSGHIVKSPEELAKEMEMKARRGELDNSEKTKTWEEFDDECEFWNEQYNF